jgi:RNA polymerase sigma-70 factor (ECF subfamily)
LLKVRIYTAVARLVDIDVAAEVLERARAGDARAQAEIYAAVAPATFTLIRRIVGDRTIAEDLFQDALMSLYQCLKGFRGEAPLGAWLRQIAVSKCLMFLRSPWNRARVRLETDDPFGSHDDARSLPSSLTTSAPRAEVFDVERALASLSPTARAVIWLYEVEGYSHEEIARCFGKTVSFSKSQVARAHMKLREWFEPAGAKETCSTI